MRNHVQLADAYYRLSDEERKYGESASITNQRTIVREYCERHGIILVEEFVDDGFSGGNFERPGFQAMLEHLRTGKANMVITKDLSRLGRDMTESSHYAERYFPEHGIRYLAPGSNFDSQEDNLMAPLQFAMNDGYLRDTSRKVKQTLNTKRNNGREHRPSGEKDFRPGRLWSVLSQHCYPAQRGMHYAAAEVPRGVP